MIIRPVLVLLPFALWGTSVSAQVPAPSASHDVGAHQVPVIDRASADQLANAAKALSNALMKLKVGALQSALEGRTSTHAQKNLTLGDLARRKDPDFERHLNQQIEAAKPRIEQGVNALNDALPAIEESLETAQRSIERAMANMPDPNYPKR